MRITEIAAAHINIDNKNGLGATPNSSEIDYLGIRVEMTPFIFRQLAMYRSRSDMGNIQHLLDAIQAGEAIAAPFIQIKIPDSWNNGDFDEPAAVTGHEGRTRMWAISELYGGNIPVETHLFFGSKYRARHITPEMLTQMNKKLRSESGVLLAGPFFTLP